MTRRAGFLSVALLLTTLYAAGHAQEGRVICVVVDDLGFGAPDRANSAKLLAILRDEVMRGSDLVAFASTGPSAVTADLEPASTHNLERAMERFAAAASPGQSRRPVQSLDATRISVGTVSDMVSSLARLQNPDKQFLILTSRTSADASFAAAYAQAGQTMPSDLANEVTAIAAAAKTGNVTLRVVSTTDPQSPALLRALR